MNIEKIKIIVNSDWSNSEKRNAIISIIADDKQVIPIVLDILEKEREQSKELLLDTNVELSRAFITLRAIPSNNIKGKAMKTQTSFILDEIKKHYLKWKDYIKCNYRVEGLP